MCIRDRGVMMPTTFELISEGRKLANELGVELCGILLGEDVYKRQWLSSVLRSGQVEHPPGIFQYGRLRSFRRQMLQPGDLLHDARQQQRCV